MNGNEGVAIEPATAERWADLEALFGDRGACGGCWCMEYRLTRSEFESTKGEGNRRALRKRVERGSPPPGLLAFHGDRAVGWCAVAPRDEFERLEHSRILAPVDDRPVWSVVCFFVDKEYRGRGVTRSLLEGAVEFARDHGAPSLEGYPVDPVKPRIPPVFAFHGLAGTFRRVGFVEVARRSETRPIMRFDF